MTQKTYHVTNPIAFAALTFPIPPKSLVFWSQGRAGGVLLFADVHYLATPSGEYVFDLPALQAGDLVTVVTFE